MEFPCNVPQTMNGTHLVDHDYGVTRYFDIYNETTDEDMHEGLLRPHEYRRWHSGSCRSISRVYTTSIGLALAYILTVWTDFGLALARPGNLGSLQSVA